MSKLTLPAKQNVQRSFDSAAATYDDNAFLQREVADRLFERLDYIKVATERIVELGCGTGYVTQKIVARYPNTQLIAIDLAPAMLACTREAIPKKRRCAKSIRA